MLNKIIDKGRVEYTYLIDIGVANNNEELLEIKRKYLYYTPLLLEYCGETHGHMNDYTVDLDARSLNFYRNGGFKEAYKRQNKKQIFSFIIAYVPIIISIIALSVSLYQCGDSNNNELEIYKANNRIDSVNVKVKGLEYIIRPSLDSMQNRWNQEKQFP
ncbi:hypothetical protein [uncultured Dysgonomonas sp.]|nr:hypothetical protein [uncultured Dysgonomonas sp.]